MMAGPTRPEPRQVTEAAVPGEVAQFNEARSAAAQDLNALIAQVAKQVGEEEADIFRAHRALMNDPALAEKVRAAIRDRRVDARTALQEVLDESAASLARTSDERLKERLADVRDVVSRLQAQLAPREARPSPAEEKPVVVVAAELLPSQVAEFDPAKVLGIVTEFGGPTGHAAILARALGIPAVFGVRGILREIRPGDIIALDGREGLVYVNPGPELRAAEERQERAFADLRAALAAGAEQEAATADGARLELLANVSGPADAALAARLGAAGVGLYRTEYFFLTHPTVPDEEEQLAAYQAVIAAAPNHRVTIRTIDLGEDKYLPLLGLPPEGNPALGWRGIRLSLAHPELLQTQLRAVLRAGALGKVSVLFPMVTSQDEVQQLKILLAQARQALDLRNVRHAADMPLGAMVEIPAAALCIDDLLAEVDFVSIGTNDLIQYLVAADRNSPRMASLCEPFSPVLYRVLCQIVKACNDHGKPVTLCGEMAGRAACFLPLLGMGLRSLSMSPVFLPAIRDLARHATLKQAQEVLDRVLRLKTAKEIRTYLDETVAAIWPSAALLDTRAEHKQEKQSTS
jgi:phosphoenolpyruvate-protein phosphotransferase